MYPSGYSSGWFSCQKYSEIIGGINMISWEKRFQGFCLGSGLTAIIILLALIFVTYAHAEEQTNVKQLSRTVLGLTYDKEGTVILADQGIEYHLPRLNERLTENYLEDVIYLDPTCVDYSKESAKENKDKRYKSPMVLFRETLLRHLEGKVSEVSKYTLLVSRVFGPTDVRPLTIGRQFICIKTEKLLK